MNVGRPTILTDEVQEKICQFLQAGTHKGIAAGLAGVSWSSFDRWMKAGLEDPNSREGEFRRAVQGAIKRAEFVLAASAFRGAAKDPRVALEYLARRHPKRWAKQPPQKHEHSFVVDDGIQALADAFARRDPSKREALTDLGPVDAAEDEP